MIEQYAFEIGNVQFFAWGKSYIHKKNGEVSIKDSIVVMSPRSSESWRPLLVIDQRIKFDYFIQIQSPFGLYLRIPFVFVRWGFA